MIDRSEEFRAELIQLMNKFDVSMDFIEDRAKLHFYTDDGRSRAVVLELDSGGVFVESVVDMIR